MHLFVTGATGYIGSAVTTALAAAGHRISALARSDTAARSLEDAGHVAIRGGLLDRAVIARAAAGSDGVVHMASPNDATSGALDRSLIDAVLPALAGTDKPFLYTSGLWLHGSRPQGIDETSPLDPPMIVAWREKVEVDVLAAANTGTRSVVIRPGVVYGAGGGLPGLLLSSIPRSGTVRYLGDGGNRWSPVHVTDLASLYVRALEGAAAGRGYLGVSGEVVTVRSIADAAAQGAGIPGSVESWPLDAATAALGPLADALVLDQPADTTRARTELGWEPTAPTLLADLAQGSYVG